MTAVERDPTKLIGRSKSKHTGVNPLKNPFYQGEYYGYYFKPKHYSDRLRPVRESDIEEAHLSISIEKGQTIFTLKEIKTSTAFNGSPMPAFELSGKLYHFENSDIACTFIADPTTRRAMTLMFSYLNLSADVRYYITAAMLTISINQTHAPLFQKMAIFRERQDVHGDPEAEKIVRGILALNGDPMVLDQDTIYNLIGEEESWEDVISPEKALKKCYVFSEAAIRSNMFFVENEDEKVKKMLLLRQKSLLPAHEIVSEPDYVADLMKHHQQRQMK